MWRRTTEARAGEFVALVCPGEFHGRRGVVRSVRGHSLVVSIPISKETHVDVPTHMLDVRSSGVGQSAFESAWLDALRKACALLPAAMQAAVRAVQERVLQDRLPLLSLLQAEPLQLQSSHLSFQEYFAARSICNGRRFPAACGAPWRWPPWWANALRLGLEMGDVFRQGLLRSSGRAEVLNGPLGLSARLDANTGAMVNTVVAPT